MQGIGKWIVSVLLAGGLAMTVVAVSKTDDGRLIIPSPKNMETGDGVLTLCEDGKAIAGILIPDGASALERQAAECLNEAIKHAGGNTLPVREEGGGALPGVSIHVGVNASFKRNPLKEEELKKFPLGDRKSTRLNSSHLVLHSKSRMPS